ncbi:MAG: carbohydrate ABC transporter permease [Endomicrobia bacterium]|nr:carbohydrate ABC transporter permease [Endomicrobiia bacterium]MDW8055792.1 carbohydrate ABC transporter permease [Elusimicrobiota bacterium]
MKNLDIGEIIRRWQVHIFLILGLVITMLPFIWMLSTSFKSKEAIFTKTPQIIPKKPTLENYLRIFHIEPEEVRREKGAIGINFWRSFLNSVIVAFTIPIISLFFNSLAAFAFAKYNFAGKDKIFTLLLATMMIPGQMTMIPVFLLLKYLGLLNSYLGLILPAAANVYGIFLIRQFMLTIPEDLIDAARIDGCSDFMIFWKIVLPLCKPVLATLAMFSFMGTWNDFLWPLIVMTSERKYTLTVALANLSGEYTTEYGLLMAGAVIVVLPIIIIYLFAQRYIIESFAHTGLKG